MGSLILEDFVSNLKQDCRSWKWLCFPWINSPNIVHAVVTTALFWSEDVVSMPSVEFFYFDILFDGMDVWQGLYIEMCHWIVNGYISSYIVGVRRCQVKSLQFASTLINKMLGERWTRITTILKRFPSGAHQQFPHTAALPIVRHWSTSTFLDFANISLK